MSVIYGATWTTATDDQLVSTVGQSLIFDDIPRLLDRFNAALNAATISFVEPATTTENKWRFKLPAADYLQRHNYRSGARPHAVKPVGDYDVALPLEDWRISVLQNDIDAAKLTVGDLRNTLTTILSSARKTVRREIGRALFRNTQRAFDDFAKGTLLIEPLANGDSVVYPPTFDQDVGSTANHYLTSGFTSANISDANNPLEIIRDTIRPHFGFSSPDGEDIVVYINRAQVPKVEGDLTDFIPFTDRFVRPGNNTDTLISRPDISGRVIGRSNGVWVSEFSEFVPANYMVGVHLEQPKPIVKRVDKEPSLGGGDLRLVVRDETHPWESMVWRMRFGLGVVNRLNGVVLELTTDTDYTIPSIYASA